VTVSKHSELIGNRHSCSRQPKPGARRGGRSPHVMRYRSISAHPGSPAPGIEYTAATRRKAWCHHRCAEETGRWACRDK
jgi:hypothetical protein